MHFLINYQRKKRNNERAETRYALLIADTHRVTPCITLRVNIYRSINFKSTASRVSTFTYVISNISELQIFRLKIVKMGTFLCRRVKFQKCGLRSFECPLFICIY